MSSLGNLEWTSLVVAVVPPPFCPQLTGNDPKMEASYSVHVLVWMQREANLCLGKQTNKGNMLSGGGLVWLYHKKGTLVHYTVSDLEKVKIQMKRMSY